MARAGRTASDEIVRPAPPHLPLTAKSGVAAFAACAVAVAVIRSLHSFDHGWWLVAYLFLVGAVSQLGLSWGYLTISRLESRPRTLTTDVLLWNLGTALVPAGVLASRGAVVALGSIVLLATLIRLAVRTRFVHSRSTYPWRFWLHAYQAFLLFLAGSVLVGTALARALPWQY